MSHLLVIASTILMTPGSLRQPIKSGEGANDRPSGIWRQTGYLHSSIDTIVRCNEEICRYPAYDAKKCHAFYGKYCQRDQCKFILQNDCSF